MLSLEEDVEAHALREQGWSVTAIARHLGWDRKTIRQYLSGQAEPGRRRLAGPDPFRRFVDYCRQRVAGLAQAAVAERGDLGVQVGADPRRLGLGDPRDDAESLDPVVDLTGSRPVQIGLHHHREQGLVHPPPLSSDGKNDPVRSFGIHNSRSPAGVDSVRGAGQAARRLAWLRCARVEGAIADGTEDRDPARRPSASFTPPSQHQTESPLHRVATASKSSHARLPSRAADHLSRREP